MKNKNNDVKLYNVIFPFWAILLFPQSWLIVLPGNFVIDSIILIISMFLLKISDKKQCYKLNIFKIFIFGLLSDIVGSGYMLLMSIVFQLGITGEEFYLTIPALIISTACIFALNYFVTFKNTNKILRLKLSLIFALFTAPYTFLIHTSWL